MRASTAASDPFRAPCASQVQGSLLLSPRRRLPLDRRRDRSLGLGANLIERRQRGQHLGRDIELLLQLGEAPAALFEGALVVALSREALFRFLTSGAECRVDVSTEQRRDVYLHLLAMDVFFAHLVAVYRPHLVFGEQDRDFGAHARASGTVGLAVRWILHADLFVG